MKKQWGNIFSVILFVLYPIAMVQAQDVGLKDILESDFKIGSRILEGPGKASNNTGIGVIDDQSPDEKHTKNFEKNFNLGQIGLYPRWYFGSGAMPEEDVLATGSNDIYADINAQINWLHERDLEVMIHLPLGPNQYMQDWFWKTNVPIEKRRLYLKKLLEGFLNANDNKNKITVLNFMNETIETTGFYRREGAGEFDMNWKLLGTENDESGLSGSAKINSKHPSFIGEAIMIIKNVAPNIKVEIRDYAIEHLEQDGRPNKKALAFYQLALHLKKKYNLDAVGFQCHFKIGQLDNVKASFGENIRKFRNAGLEVYITELDIPKFGCCPKQTLLVTLTEEELQQQKEDYKSVFTIALNAGVSKVSFWGFRDGNDEGWLKNQNGVLFTRNYEEKPAYEGVKEALENYEPVLSIDESLNRQISINIYPNPSKNQVTIQSNSQRVKGIELIDMFGKRWQPLQTIAALGRTLDVSTLPAGVYFLNIDLADKVIRKKLIKL